MRGFSFLVVLGLLGFPGVQFGESTQFYSQASQDRFVYELLYHISGKQGFGYYLEIGAGHPQRINNTYYLEKNCGWRGVSLDISKGLIPLWAAQRKNTFLCGDATEVDYSAILEPFPHEIDYLSLDIDGEYDHVLSKIPLDRYIFKVITIEHDAYRYGDQYRTRERELLTSHGYYLLCPDVSYNENAFEDWWIYPDAFPARIVNRLKSMDLEGQDHKKIIELFAE